MLGVKRGDRNENVFPRPDGLRENAEAAISCSRDLDLPERRNRYDINNREEEEEEEA